MVAGGGQRDPAERTGFNRQASFPQSVCQKALHITTEPSFSRALNLVGCKPG